MPRFAYLLALSLAACGTRAEALPTPAANGELHIEVGAHGYTPPEARAAANQPLRLVFTRTSNDGCGQELVFPSLGIRRDLPLNEPVAVDVTMPASGSLAFTCGMNMYRGAVVVQ